jgi:hypothetical protein
LATLSTGLDGVALAGAAVQAGSTPSARITMCAEAATSAKAVRTSSSASTAATRTHTSLNVAATPTTCG